MVLNHVIGSAVAVALICIAAFQFVQARSAFSSPEAPAGGEDPVLTGDNVIKYPNAFNTPLIDPVRTLRYGTKVDGGCRYSSFGSMRPGYTMMEGRMLALNPDTCEYIWEEGAVAPEHQEGLMEDVGPGTR